MQVNLIHRTPLGTQETKVDRLCSWPTKLKLKTKTCCKTRVLEPQNLIVGVRYLESARLQILCGYKYDYAFVRGKANF